MIVCSLSTAVRAVGQTISYTSRVIHLWVDPKNGNDGAVALNPNLNYACQSPLPRHPCDVLDANGKVLLHAPFPFKTVTAAINSLPKVGGKVELPFTGGIGNNQVIWEYAVIHCLPGWYAPGSIRNAANGQLANGETFPIALPNRVSIKGTSALNTVFDGIDLPGPLFHFGGAANTRGIGSYIDSVSMIGVGWMGGGGTNTAQGSAAVYLGAMSKTATTYASSPTISNCLIYGNVVGVLVNCTVDSNTPPNPVVTHDGLTLINNTIAFNGFGLWSGWFDPSTPTSGNPIRAYGYSKLNLINNIFDSSPQTSPTSPYRLPAFNPALPLRLLIPYTSGFEGIHFNDLTLSGLSVNGDTNAYESDTVSGVQRYDSAAVIPGLNLPPTYSRGSVVPGGVRNRPTTPGIDIGPITGRRLTTQRGVLYVQDLMRLGRATAGQFQAANPDFDGSPHDFRLSPAILSAYDGEPDPLPTPGASGTRNPLVDRGWAGSFPVGLQNGQTILNAPGYLAFTINPGAQSTWLWTNWDQDCEGSGNPRVRDHPAFPNASGWGWGIDIGADELGDSIKAGPRFGTTRYFSITDAESGLPFLTAAMDHKYVWQIGLPRSRFPGEYQLVNGGPQHYRSNYLVQNSSGQWVYAPGESWKDPSWSFTPAATYYQPKVVDVTPHLLPDLHPWWTYGTTSMPITGFPSNPFWKLLDDSAAPGSCSNASAAVNLNLYGDPNNRLGAGVINPPGTVLPPAWAVFRWLDHILTTNVNSPDFEYFAPANVAGVCAPGGTFGHANSPVTQCLAGGPNAFSTYDDWCRGRRTITGTNTPTGPTFDLLRPTYQLSVITAERYTLEYRGSTAWQSGLAGSNIQSFLVAVETK